MTAVNRPQSFSANRLPKHLTPYFLILPVVLYYIAFWGRPVFSVLAASITDPNTGAITLDNFWMVLQDEMFAPAFWNTFLIVAISVTLEFFIALLIALLIYEQFWGSSIFFFLMLIPMALPPVATAAIWQTGLTAHGWLNSLLIHLNILEEGEKIYWLGTFQTAKTQLLAVIILVDAWTVIPSVMVILVAGLQNIPTEAIEAGYVFGGHYFRVLKDIILPLLRPTIQTAVVLRLIAAIQIWLIIVLLLGFGRLPVLVERIVYYHEMVPGLEISQQMATGYTVVVSLIVSFAALLYLYFSGAFEKTS
ncbi:sugar ABC transporter permease [Candidatus Parcubacteria bacterium]|nr:MAG: sugar ABC transporter permease [Candidatus Parcubacteria bacterium]